jgi:amino acid transporter
MATLIPVTGSFVEYAERFIDDCLAFALGWAYWWLWVTVSEKAARRDSAFPMLSA